MSDPKNESTQPIGQQAEEHQAMLETFSEALPILEYLQQQREIIESTWSACLDDMREKHGATIIRFASSHWFDRGNGVICQLTGSGRSLVTSTKLNTVPIDGPVNIDAEVYDLQKASGAFDPPMEEITETVEPLAWFAEQQAKIELEPYRNDDFMILHGHGPFKYVLQDQQKLGYSGKFVDFDSFSQKWYVEHPLFNEHCDNPPEAFCFDSLQDALDCLWASRWLIAPDVWEGERSFMHIAWSPAQKTFLYRLLRYDGIKSNNYMVAFIKFPSSFLWAEHFYLMGRKDKLPGQGGTQWVDMVGPDPSLASLLRLMWTQRNSFPIAGDDVEVTK